MTVLDGVRRWRRPSWLVVPALLAAIAFAVEFVVPGEPAAPPIDGPTGANAARATAEVGRFDVALDLAGEAARQRTGQVAAATAAGEATPNTTSEAWAIDVVDSAGRVVAGAEIEVWDADSRLVALQASQGGGTAGFVPDSHGRAGPGWRVAVRVPGRRVDVPWSSQAHAGRMTVNIGDVGTLRIACDGGGADLRVADAEDRWAVELAAGPTPVDVVVAAGALPFRITARTRGWQLTEPVVGPGGQGDVVDVRLDLRGVLVTGRLVGEEVEDLPVKVHLSGAFPSAAFGLGVVPDGNFAIEVPHGRATTISFLCFDDCATRDVPALLAGPYDLGRVDLTRRARLGTLVVRDPEGAVSLEEPSVVKVTMVDGRDGWQELVRFRTGRDGGLDLLAAPGVASAIVAPRSQDRFCVPANVAIHGGGVFQAQLVAGSRVVVRVVEPGAVRWREIFLRDMATRERCDCGLGTGRIDEATSTLVRELRGVPPGSYELIAEDAELIGGPLVVLPGSEQQVTVTVRPR